MMLKILNKHSNILRSMTVHVTVILGDNVAIWYKCKLLSCYVLLFFWAISLVLKFHFYLIDVELFDIPKKIVLQLLNIFLSVLAQYSSVSLSWNIQWQTFFIFCIRNECTFLHKMCIEVYLTIAAYFTMNYRGHRPQWWKFSVLPALMYDGFMYGNQYIGAALLS